MQGFNSLRSRAALGFALFGGVLGAVLSVALYRTSMDVGSRLMRETLQAELEDSVERHARDQVFVPPNTASIKGYVLSGREAGDMLPPDVRTLQPGWSTVSIDGIEYLALVADRNDARYFMLYSTELQHKREDDFFDELLLFSLLMTLGSAAGGFWLAAHIVAPVIRLAERVGQAGPEIIQMPLSKLVRDDEVGDLARAFERYVQRINEFIEREKNFTGDAGHELRTPLSVILGAVEVLEQDAALNAKQRERLVRIKHSALEMVEMTHALLLLAREHTAGTDEPLCQAAPVLREAFDKHRAAMCGRDVELQLELLDDPTLIAERSLLFIAVDNLLRNALFHTRQGHVRLALGADRLVVSDSGSGMTAEELAHAFDRHYKGKASTGFGVGLSLVKRICERYGWRVEIASRSNEGTSVTIHFLAVPGFTH